MISRLKGIVTDKSVQKFLIVGVVSFAIDYGLLLILHNAFGVQLNVATTIAYLTGLVVNFTLNKVWTFSAPKGVRQSAKQAIQYGILVVFNLLATNVVVSMAEAAGVGPEVSKPVATAAIMVLNYVVYQRIIFRERPPVEPFAG